MTDATSQRQQRPVLIVDAANMFIRHFTANPTLSAHGVPMGGTVGFMNMLRTLVEQNVPTEVVIVWEGGGSSRRRQLFPEYKSHRRPDRMNRFYQDDIPNTVENRNDQVKAIVACLKCVPVRQVYVSDCEADDIIAYLIRARYADRKVVIVSSDRDFYQLVGDDVKIFRLGKKIFVTKDDIVREFGVSPSNFSLAKAVCGDDSDNIPGVEGVGFKTMSKRFPTLAGDERIELDTLLTECAARSGEKVKVFSSIASAADIVRRNHRLVDLDGSMLGPEQRRAADYVLDSYEPRRNKIELVRELIRLGLNEFNVDGFFYTMASLA